jgi:phage shock protein A
VANLDAARLIRELRVEVRRWAEKAQEAGEAYGNANTKHHAELDRANRLERLANTLAERAVDLEDWARTAERALAEECAKVARVEALIDQWDGEIGAQEDYQHASAVRAVEACLRDLRAALVGPEAS